MAARPRAARARRQRQGCRDFDTRPWHAPARGGRHGRRAPAKGTTRHRSRRPIDSRHLAPAAEIADLLSRYPDERTRQKGEGPSQPPALITGPPDLPAWKVGSEWHYRYESPSDSGVFAWRVPRIEDLVGVPHHVGPGGRLRDDPHRL